MKYLLLSIVCSWSSLLYSQSYFIADTTISSHSKYNWIDQGVEIQLYYLSKKDYYNYIDSKNSKNSKQSILNKYSPWNFELLHCNDKDYIPPYEAYSIICNNQEYDFALPLAKYHLNVSEKININLKKKCPHYAWDLESEKIIVRFISKGITIQEEVKSFPVTINKLSLDVEEIRITVQNRYKDSMDISFVLK